MRYTLETLDRAIYNVSPYLVHAHAGRVMNLKYAAVDCFLDLHIWKDTDEEAILRQALRDLKTDGQFKFEDDNE